MTWHRCITTHVFHWVSTVLLPSCLNSSPNLIIYRANSMYQERYLYNKKHTCQCFNWIVHWISIENFKSIQLVKVTISQRVPTISLATSFPYGHKEVWLYLQKSPQGRDFYSSNFKINQSLDSYKTPIRQSLLTAGTNRISESDRIIHKQTQGSLVDLDLQKSP